MASVAFGAGVLLASSGCEKPGAGVQALRDEPEPTAIRLDEHAEDKLSRPNAWRNYVANIPLAAQRDTALMIGKGCMTKVEIAPTVGSSAVSHKRVNGHKEGYVVARIVNLGPCEVRKYKIPAGATVHWVVELGKSDNTFKSRLISLGSGTGNDSDIGKGVHIRWTECGSHEPAGVDFARITDTKDGCMFPLNSPAAIGGRSAFEAAAAAAGASDTTAGAGLRPLFDDPLTFWFSCSQTCCYADM
jgi:hypothetical protein